MSVLALIIVFGLLMSGIALVGSVTLVFSESTLERIVLPLVAFAAGSLIGGAFFHMLPAAIEHFGDRHLVVFVWTSIGFVVFLVLEQVLNWHHCHRPLSQHKQPLTYMILVADGLHNLIGGLSIGAIFLLDVRLGITAWIAAAAHEVPQELGDFGVLVHGGWKKGHALLFNFISALTFPLGALVAYGASSMCDVAFLVPFAAGNFLYIGAVDLVPEVSAQCGDKVPFLHTAAIVFGLALLLVLAAV
jgi:zinc and cadmium transporter